LSTAPICVFLVDDHAAFRMPLALVLEQERDLVVATQAGSVAEAKAALPEMAGMIDIALIDLRLPDGSGLEVVRALRVANPQAQVIVLTADTDKVQHARAIEAGAVAVINKCAPPADIVEAIRRVHDGNPVQSVQELLDLLRLAGEDRERKREVETTLAQLTSREREVLAALAEGLDNKAIAERLYISPETARTHVVKVLGKLGVESRLQAAIFAIKHGVGSTS
jgi:DNA-binding NarL/FixJ family response regulator